MFHVKRRRVAADNPIIFYATQQLVPRVAHHIKNNATWRVAADNPIIFCAMQQLVPRVAHHIKNNATWRVAADNPIIVGATQQLVPRVASPIPFMKQGLFAFIISVGNKFVKNYYIGKIDKIRNKKLTGGHKDPPLQILY